MKFLWIDDERPVAPWFNNGNAAIARTYDDAIDIFLDLNDGSEIYISFDHDLGNGKTGYDFAKWLIEHQCIGYFHVHSMNPVGAANIRQLLSHYGWKEIKNGYLGYLCL